MNFEYDGEKFHFENLNSYEQKEKLHFLAAAEFWLLKNSWLILLAYTFGLYIEEVF